MPAGQWLLVPFELSSCAAVPAHLPSALPHQAPYFIRSFLPQRLNIMFAVSTEYLPDIDVFPLFCVASGGAVVCWLTCQPGCERAVGVKEAGPSGASTFTRVPASEGLTPSLHGAHPAGRPFAAAPLHTHHSTSLPLPPVQSNTKFQSISAWALV